MSNNTGQSDKNPSPVGQDAPRRGFKAYFISHRWLLLGASLGSLSGGPIGTGIGGGVGALLDRARSGPKAARFAGYGVPRDKHDRRRCFFPAMIAAVLLVAIFIIEVGLYFWFQNLLEGWIGLVLAARDTMVRSIPVLATIFQPSFAVEKPMAGHFLVLGWPIVTLGFVFTLMVFAGLPRKLLHRLAAQTSTSDIVKGLLGNVVFMAGALFLLLDGISSRGRFLYANPLETPIGPFAFTASFLLLLGNTVLICWLIMLATTKSGLAGRPESKS